MKIVFIVNEFPSLSQTFVLNQITGLIDRGHTVDIFAEEERSDFKNHDEVKRYNLLEHTCYPLKIPQNKIFRFFEGLYYVNKYMTKYPLAILKSLNVFRYGRKAASLTLLYQIIPFLEKGPFDIIHCQFGMLGPDVLQFKNIAARSAKLVTSFRGYDASRYIHNKPGIYDELFKEGNIFLSVSQSLKENLIKEGCSEKKIIVLRSGIDCKKFNNSIKKKSEGKQTIVLTIARLVEKKGIAYAIEAIAKLVASGRCVKYVVVGDGTLRGELERLIEDLGVQAHVQLIGWKNHDEVIRLLQNTHILVAPSVTATNGDQEGIPNVIKEGMALGVPVVTTFHSGIPELVEDGVSGFLVKERDVESLTYRLSYLIDHPEKGPIMGMAGRTFVQENYDINKLNEQLVGVYRNLLKGKCSNATV